MQPGTKTNIVSILSLVLAVGIAGAGVVSSIVRAESTSQVNTRDIEGMAKAVEATNRKIDEQDKKINQIITDIAVMKTALGIKSAMSAEIAPLSFSSESTYAVSHP